MSEYDKKAEEISIHAPKSGATKASRAGLTPTRFQSTLPSRERLCGKRHCPCRRNFNPRSQAGSDAEELGGYSTEWNFNPRSQAGSDSEVNCCNPRANAFQSTLPSRERLSPTRCPMIRRAFQSTLPSRERQIEQEGCLQCV